MPEQHQERYTITIESFRNTANPNSICHHAHKTKRSFAITMTDKMKGMYRNTANSNSICPHAHKTGEVLQSR
jgi:hypothetical protein